jgi:hypothetical protein
MTLTTSIGLNAIAWTQEIRRYPTINVEGLYLHVTCTVLRPSSLLLNDRRSISDLEFHLSIFPGDTPDNHSQLSEKAIGGLWSHEDEDDFFIHGSFYLKASDYQAVWEQVIGSNYVECRINLEVFPVQYDNGDIWRDNPLSIESASISFKRKVISESPVKIEYTRKKPQIFTNQSWSIVLFLMASVAYGSIFEYSKGITTGESRIIAAILFVGGLLLWFSSKGAR